MSSLGFLLIFVLWLVYEPILSVAVKLQKQNKQVVIDNGIIEVTISNPVGIVTGIKYNGINNLLEDKNDEEDRGYWDLVWLGEGNKKKKGTMDRMDGTEMAVITENEEQVELSFTGSWDASQKGKGDKAHPPLKVDKRYILRRNSSGLYTYAIFEHLKGHPAVEIANLRLAFKLNKEKFRYMSVTDDKQRYMPSAEDREKGRGQELEYPEAVLLTNPVEPEFKGEVDDKYQYSLESKDIKVHGWICDKPPTGMWQITPSNEYRSAGPVKQYMTSHVGPTSLTMGHSTHFTGADFNIQLKADEPWKKVFGPIFVYVNSFKDGGDDPHKKLWEDAKKQVETEVKSWPYNFVDSKDFPRAEERGKFSGKLMISDRYASDKNISAKGAYVGLAPQGNSSSWQKECKGYQFWTQADEDGSFSINNIRSGDYNLYAFVPGFIGDYKFDDIITIKPGSDIKMDNLCYSPPRDGPTLWEIGTADRSAAEFYVPDPNPKYINRVFIDHTHDRFRQYGLWERYGELYPIGKDLVYTVNVSDYKKDWFFAQNTRKKDDNTYEGTTWTIKFKLNNVDKNGNYKLRVALATANYAELQVRVNEALEKPPLFTTGQIGKDNTIARHGIHGQYRFFAVDVKGELLKEGENTILLTQALGASVFTGLMYDYIRLEGPASSSSMPTQSSPSGIETVASTDENKSDSASIKKTDTQEKPSRGNIVRVPLHFIVFILFMASLFSNAMQT